MKKSYIYIAFMVTQVVLLTLAFSMLRNEAFYLYTALELIGVFAVVSIVYSKENPSIKIFWILMIMLLPVFGLVIYMLLGSGKMSENKLGNMRKIVIRSSKYEGNYRDLTVDLKQMAIQSRMPDAIDDKYIKQVKYIEKQTGRPLYKGVYSEYLKSGEDKLKSLIEALNKAEKFIHLEYFIIERGVMWDSIEEVLLRKAKEGVEVRVLYDQMGCIDYIDDSWNERLIKAGIKVGVFHKMTIVPDKRTNLRDHRKIVVIDGVVGFTGGINIGDEYINVKKLHGYWKDTAVKISGGAVVSMSIIFLNDWIYSTGEHIDYEKYIAKPQNFKDGGYTQVFEVNPGMHGSTARNVLINIVSNADKYVYITTPYLVLDDNIISALCVAARGGIDVRIILPGIPDHKYVYIVSCSYFDELLAAGVKVYLFKPGFVHSKMVIADGKLALLGSINLDFRSYYLNYEVGALLLYTNTIAKIEEDYAACLQKCLMVDRDKQRKRPMSLKAAEKFLRLFAPLM